MASSREELGRKGYIFFGGYTADEWHNRLRGILGVRAYREMQDNDAIIGASMGLTKNVIRQVKWYGKPPEGRPQAQKWADFLTECLQDLETKWADNMSDILTFLTFGWSYFEKTLKVRTDGLIGWKDIAIRGQESLLRWELDQQTGACLGMWQSAAPTYVPTFIPREKAVHFKLEGNRGNPEGKSLLRNCYRSYYFLKRLQEIEAIGIERDLAGIPIVKLPVKLMDPNAPAEMKAVRAAYDQLVTRIRRNEFEGITFPSATNADGTPSGYELSLLNSGGSRQISCDVPIARYTREIATVFHTQFLLLGSSGSSGSWALSSDQTDMYALSLGALLGIIQDTFNSDAVAELMTLNGVPEEDWPTLAHGDIETREIEKFANAVRGMVADGVLTADKGLEKYVREEFGLPPKDETPEGEEPADVADPEETEAEVEDDASVTELGVGKVRSILPPMEVAHAARRALEVRASKPKHMQGMTPVGLARARDLANRRPVTQETLQRMVAFFARHEADKQGETWREQGPGWQAWHGWGGDSGRQWAERALAGMENVEKYLRGEMGE